MYTSLLHFLFYVNNKLIHNPAIKNAWRRGTGPGGVKHKIQKVIHRYRYKVENQSHLHHLIKPYLFGLFIWLISERYLTNLFFAPYLNITCLSLPYYILQGLIYYYTRWSKMQKKSPLRFWPAGGFDDDERTVDIASTIYILAYFLTKFKFIFHYFHCKNVINLFISILFLSITYFIGLCSCGTYR